MNALSEMLRKFLDKKYRDGYMQTHVRAAVAYQVQALREKFGITQAEFAERTGKKQSVISRLENTDYGKVSVQTLLDIASGMDVALLVKFVSYPEFLQHASEMVNDLQPQTIQESFEVAHREPAINAYTGGVSRVIREGAKVNSDYQQSPEAVLRKRQDVRPVIPHELFRIKQQTPQQFGLERPSPSTWN